MAKTSGCKKREYSGACKLGLSRNRTLPAFEVVRVTDINGITFLSCSGASVKFW
jgi:hypothetical protein